MERVRSSKNFSYAYKKSFQKKDNTGKANERRKNTFMQIVCKNPNKTKKSKVQYGFGYSGYVASVYDTYIVELDAHKNSEPHFHLWDASNAGNRISDTRSQGISLNSSINNGIAYTEQELKNEKQLNELKRKQMLYFVEDNRYLLFLMYNAFVMNKAKSFVNLDEESVYQLFTKAELASLNQKFKLFLQNQNNSQFGN